MARRLVRNGAILVIVAMSALASETRQHFGLTTTAHDRFAITRIDRVSDAETRYVVLVRDEQTNMNYRLEATRNFRAQTYEFRLTDLQARDTFIAARYKLPLTSRSQSETRAELPRAAGRPVDLTLSAPGVSITKTEAEWHSPAIASAAKNQLLGRLPAAFATVIDRLQAVAVVPQLADFCADFLGYFASAPDCRPRSGVALTTLPPDCGFDATRGERCSEPQLDRAKRIRSKGQGRYY